MAQPQFAPISPGKIVGGFNLSSGAATNGPAIPIGGMQTTSFGRGVGGSGCYVDWGGQTQIIGRASGGTYAGAEHSVMFLVSDCETGANIGWLYDQQSSGESGATNWTIDASMNFKFGTNAIGSVPASGFVVLIGHSGNSNKSIYPTGWVNGTKTIGNTYWDSWIVRPMRYLFGSQAYPTNNTFIGVGHAFAIWRGLVSDAQALSLSQNPWQLFSADY